jgi:hypothetical protein
VQHRFRSVITALALVAAPTAAMLVTAPSAVALTTITVTTTADGGPGSLRQAFADANAAAPDDAEIVLQGGEQYLLADCDAGALDHSATNTLTLSGRGSIIEQTCDDRVIDNVGSAGHLTVTDTTITGGAVGDLTAGGGIGASSGGLTIVQSTIAGNVAGSGGAVFVTGGGSLTVINSTIADNVATSASGTGGIEAQGGITLAYATITGNTAGGTNEPANLRTGATLTSFGSVVAQPLGTDATNCVVQAGTTSQGYNWSDDATCGFTAGTDVQNGGDPGLGPLAAASRIPLDSDCLSMDCGAAYVRMPLTGSPLIDAIPYSACQTGVAAGITDDEVTLSRPSPTGGACDIGAVEVQVRRGQQPVAPSTPAADPILLSPRFTG